LISDLINRCYEDIEVTPAQINEWTGYSVFDNDLWVFIYENESDIPVALGIADFDKDIKEGSLEWIQVLPEKRGLGLGQALVSELLRRLKGKADFVTVSGQSENNTNPEAVYRKCGFTGDDVWCILKRL
jgi:GNAT superfamily N-acetyltransferase